MCNRMRHLRELISNIDWEEYESILSFQKQHLSDLVICALGNQSTHLLDQLVHHIEHYSQLMPRLSWNQYLPKIKCQRSYFSIVCLLNHYGHQERVVGQTGLEQKSDDVNFFNLFSIILLSSF